MVLNLSKNEPNPNCPIGKNINKHLTDLYQDMDELIIKQLSQMSLLDFRKQF